MNKTPTVNERFGASVGVVSADTEQVTSFFALVPTFPIPPPAAKPQNVVCKWWTKISTVLNINKIAMNTKIIFLAFIVFLTGNIYGQENDGLFSRLQGISNRGIDWFNIDGIEITSQKLDVEFSAKNCAKKFPQLKIKEKELTTSDSLLDFRNYYVYKSEKAYQNLFLNESYYFVESPEKKLIAFTFASINKNNKEFERNFIKLVCNNSIPDSIFNSPEIANVNFAGRKIPLGNSCRWMGVNNVQCPHYGQINWSIHKSLEDAAATVENQYTRIISEKKGKIESDTIVNVIFEGVVTKARRVVHDFTGVRGFLLSMEGGKKLTIYFVSAPIRDNFVSCVMSFWGSDQIKPSGLPPLLEQVMKLK